jgi:hypothetical protein
METNTIPWDIESVEKELKQAFNKNEVDLLDVLKKNSFLFYELFFRKYGIQPIFKEVSFGDKYRCDFAWLNDNSDGPEWTLLEVESPTAKLFTSQKKPTQQLNNGIEQVKSWKRYFEKNPEEKRRIFGFVSRFRYILIIGHSVEWETKHAAEWRQEANADNKIEIHSMEVFKRPLEILSKHPEELWSFAENPIAHSFKELEFYCNNSDYLKIWKNILM